MPTTNPYGYDQTAADINQGSKPSPDTSYVTQNPVTTSGFGSPQPSQSPSSFGGSGSALATNLDWGSSQPKSPPLAPTTQPVLPQPTSWTAPLTGILSHPAPTGYNSPTPPPGMQAPPGTSWITDGQGHYGWGYPAQTTSQPIMGQQSSPTAVTHPVAGQTPVISGTGGLTFGPPTFSAPPAQTTSQPTMQTPLPQQDFWSLAAGNPIQTAPVNWGTPAPPDFWASASQPPNSGAPPTPPVSATAPAATTVMSTGVAPWAAALNGGWNMPAFTNPDQGAGTVPTTQYWNSLSPTEQSAVASLNWSTTGMTSADLSNYLQRSAPQWNTPAPATYRSY